MESINALGKKESSVARVYLSDGKGKITVNGRVIKNTFGAETLQYVVTQPLVLLKSTDKYDINANLDGGGVKGQAELSAWEITRALIMIDAESKAALKAEGFVTRDPREVKGKSLASQKHAGDSSSVNDKN